MTRIYLDASALVKLTVAENGSEAVLRMVDAASRVITSVLALVEVRRAVLRVDPDADPWAVLGRCTIMDLDPEIIESAATLAPRDLRSLDAIHVASALSVASDLDAFVTFDHRQAAAAKAAGLPVEVPA